MKAPAFKLLCRKSPSQEPGTRHPRRKHQKEPRADKEQKDDELSCARRYNAIFA